MKNTITNKFVSEVHSLALKYCTDEFGEVFKKFRNDQGLLQPAEAGKLQGPDISQFLNFDILLLQARQYSTEQNYIQLLFKIGQLSIQYGHFQKAEYVLNLIKTEYGTASDKRIRANTYKMLAEIAFYHSDLPKAKQDFAQSLEIFYELSDWMGISGVTNSLGALEIESGQFDEAQKLFEKARGIAMDNDLETTQIKTAYNLGNLHVIQGNWEESINHFEESLLLAEKQQNIDLTIRINHSIGLVYKFKGDHALALQQLDKCFRLCDDNGNAQMKGLTLLEIAENQCLTKDLDSALTSAIDAFSLIKDFGDDVSLADINRVLGMIHRENSNFDIALSHFQTSLAINESQNNPLTSGETQFELGKCYAAMNDSEKARQAYNAALKSFKSIYANSKLTEVEEVLSAVL